MPAPIRPNTAAAAAANRRRGDEAAAVRLRAAGWHVQPPEEQPAIRIKTLNWLTVAEARAALVALTTTLDGGYSTEVYPTDREYLAAERAHTKLRNIEGQ